MIQPSDQELAGLPETSRIYINDLEAENDRLLEQSAVLTERCDAYLGCVVEIWNRALLLRKEAAERLDVLDDGILAVDDLPREWHEVAAKRQALFWILVLLDRFFTQHGIDISSVNLTTGESLEP